MKLLLDQNLSHRLVEWLDDIFPGSIHVRDLGLAAATDDEVWEHAKQSGLIIVSKDADFRQRSFLHGPPPKVVWLRVGNRSTNDIHTIVRGHLPDFAAFEVDPVAALLVITA